MIKNVFKVEKLFELKSIKKMLSKSDCIKNGIYPVCSSDTSNNGIIGYYDNPEFIMDAENPVYITFGDHTRTLNIMQQSFSVIDNTKVLRPKIHSINALLYIITVWKKQIKDLGYARHWKIAKNCELNLPILLDKYNNPVLDSKKEYHKDGYIPDIEYMEKRIKELEEERIKELTTYLTVSGYKGCKLTSKEEKAINDLNNSKIEFKEFNITSKNGIFDVKNTHSILQEWIVQNSGNIPYVTAGVGNNSITTYITPKNAEWIEKGHSIMIGGKTLVITYQEQDYVSNDSHNLALYLKKDKIYSENVYLFLVVALYKSLKPKYEWGDSISKTKIQKDIIKLPINDRNEIDFDFMETYISAIKKLTIKNVVDWRDKQINATKQIVNNE